MKFKIKTKVLATIVGATMLPVVFPGNMFMTTQVCHAVETISLKDAVIQLVDNMTNCNYEKAIDLFFALNKYVEKNQCNLDNLLGELRKYINDCNTEGKKNFAQYMLDGMCSCDKRLGDLEEKLSDFEEKLSDLGKVTLGYTSKTDLIIV